LVLGIAQFVQQNAGLATSQTSSPTSTPGGPSPATSASGGQIFDFARLKECVMEDGQYPANMSGGECRSAIHDDETMLSFYTEPGDAVVLLAAGWDGGRPDGCGGGPSHACLLILASDTDLNTSTFFHVAVRGSALLAYLPWRDVTIRGLQVAGEQYAWSLEDLCEGPCDSLTIETIVDGVTLRRIELSAPTAAPS
jgi:hypothetical protein